MTKKAQSILKRLSRGTLAGLLAVFCAAGLQSGTPASADNPAKPVIPSGTKEFQGHYYAVYNDLEAMNASWETADRLCKAAGGHLAVINSIEENNYLAKLVRESDCDAAFFGAYYEDDMWKWCNGDNFEYTNWSDLANDGSPYGLFMNSDTEGLWHSSRFGLSGMAYICEWDSGMPCNMTLQNRSTENLVHYDHKWYQFYDVGLKLEDAETFCKAQGGRLACITSEELQNQLMEKLTAGGTKNMYWIGGRQIADWSWYDGAEGIPMDYQHWADGEPASNNAASIYAALNLKSERFPQGCWVAESASGANYNEAEYYPNYGLICEWDTECVYDGIEYPWHETELVEIEPATCQQEGLSQYICKHCGKKLQTKSYPKTDHTFEAARIYKKFAFNPIPGFLKYKCQNCDETKFELEPKGLVLDGTLFGLVVVAIAAYFAAVRDYKALKSGTATKKF